MHAFVHGNEDRARNAGAVDLTGIHRVLALDTRRDPASTQALCRFWTQLAVARLDAGSEGVFSYNVLGVSERDLHRLRELQANYYQRMRSIIAESEPVERVVVANSQLFALDAPKLDPDS